MECCRPTGTNGPSKERSTDGIEKSFGGWTRSYPFPGDDALAIVSSGFIWDNALLHGLSFRNFGEMGMAASDSANSTFKQIYDDYKNHSGRIKFKLTTGIDLLAPLQLAGLSGMEPDDPRRGARGSLPQGAQGL